ncbi:MAG: hypothetical protein HZA89_05250 [Verrucomicrobia bacterium]|nr:hypothetical protein [Verrucomicrobiota bacterium]
MESGLEPTAPLSPHPGPTHEPGGAASMPPGPSGGKDAAVPTVSGPGFTGTNRGFSRAVESLHRGEGETLPAIGQAERARIEAKPAKILPLPKGTGRGEGKESARTDEPLSAHLPRHFIAEPQQRIEIYRKLALAEDRTALEALRVEVRDRFGPLPKPAELLWLATEVKQLCATRGITRLETQSEKLMLTRRDGYLTLGGKFPRLTRKTPEAKLKEIKRLLLSL